MVELLIAVLAVSTMYKIADADQKPPVQWASISAVIIVLAIFLIPLPLARVGIGFILALGVLFAYNFTRK
jgi:hypothetical protein